MRLKEIEKRLKEIQAELENENADVSVLEKEANDLISERNSILDNAERRKKVLEDIVQNHPGETIRTFEGAERLKTSTEDVEKHYRNAFLKTLLKEPLTEDEQRAYVHTTENTGEVVPKETQDKIYTRMEEKHPILKDVELLRTGAVITIVKHTTINAGDAKQVAEAEANGDEQNTFVNVTLSGKDFSKHVDFSYRLGKMAIPAFEAYLVKEIGDRIGAAMAREVVAQVKKDLSSDNKLTPTDPSKMTFDDVLKALSLLKKTGNVYVYANSTSIYGSIAKLEGAEGRLSFIPNYKEAISGQLIGKGIKEEDALADGEILFLDPDQFIFNVVQDIMLERGKDIKTHVHTISGFAIAEGTLTNDKAGALVSVTIGG